MKDILEEIVAHKRMELERMKAALGERPLHRLVEQDVEQGGLLPSLRKALADSPTGIIAEFKRRSPSHGEIMPGGDAAAVTLAYEQAGASAVSILTDTRYFGGTDGDIRSARRSGLTLPVLYKNFVIDEYQLFQARHCGASAVLLIAACLSKDDCRSLLRTAHELDLEVLLEMHDERETEYADLLPDLCGINNRNLGTLSTTVENSFRLASRLPREACKVSESGIHASETVARLRLAGYRGFLIGGNFMQAESPAKALATFIDKLKDNPI